MSLCKASKYFQVCFGTFFLYFADCFSYILEWEDSISPSFHLSFFSKFTDVLFLLTLFALVNQCSFSQVPYATLHDKVNKTHSKKLEGGEGWGVRSALSQELEVYIYIIRLSQIGKFHLMVLVWDVQSKHMQIKKNYK